MTENKTEKFSSFTQWLSSRLNLPADMVSKTILLIPPDERRDIKNLRQWRTDPAFMVFGCMYFSYQF